jgi:hypothetical protein
MNRHPTLLPIFAALLLFMTPWGGLAQHTASKWGKVPEEDLTMTYYEPDPASAAVVLQDVGEMVVKDFGQNWGVELNRHRRIKVFTAKNFDQGIMVIPYRNAAGERISSVEAQVILPSGEKVKVNSDNIFTENLNGSWSAKKIFVPNLCDGCIIEYRYHLHCEDIVGLYPWEFQSELPTRWSTFSAVIPTFFEYANLITRTKEFDLLTDEPASSIAADGSRIPANRVKYGVSKLPALKSEPFMTTIQDYSTSIHFQLKAINYNNRPAERYMTSWEDLALKLENHDKMGYQYLKDARFARLWNDFVAYVGPVEDRNKLPEQALRFVGKNIKWNGEYRIFVPETLDAAYARRTGSSSEINLAVVALLRKAGVDAVPLLISTRANGTMHPQYPFYQQFNSVVAYVRQPRRRGIFLDATDPYQPINELRDQHYNGGGWQLDPEKAEWMVVQTPEIAETWYGNLDLQADGTMFGDFSISVEGPFAADWRYEMDASTPAKVLRKRFAIAYPDIVFDSIEVKDRKEPSRPLQIRFKCRIPNTATTLNNYLYCKPVLDFFMVESPFKSLKRSFPINFPYFHRANYVLNLTLPPGFRLEEVPESAKITLPRDGGRLHFSVSQTAPNQLQLAYKFNLNQLDFMPDEYDNVRQFFDLMVEKTGTQLVLKKT